MSRWGQVPQRFFVGAGGVAELAEQSRTPARCSRRISGQEPAGAAGDQFGERDLGRQAPFRRHGRRFDTPGQRFEPQPVEDSFHFGSGETQPLEVPGQDVQPLGFEPEKSSSS